jgi:hypothetical protein
MSYNFDSNAPSPETFWSGASAEDLDTPLTGSSLLSEDQGIENTAANLGAEYILVVGGCGFIGSHTVWELAKAGHNACFFQTEADKAKIHIPGHRYRQFDQLVQGSLRHDRAHGYPALLC